MSGLLIVIAILVSALVVSFGALLSLHRQEPVAVVADAVIRREIEEHRLRIDALLERGQVRLKGCEQRTDPMISPLSADGARFLGGVQRIFSVLEQRRAVLHRLCVPPANLSDAHALVRAHIDIPHDHVNSVIGAPTIPAMSFDALEDLVEVLLDRVEQELDGAPQRSVPARPR